MGAGFTPAKAGGLVLKVGVVRPNFPFRPGITDGQAISDVEAREHGAAFLPPNKRRRLVRSRYRGEPCCLPIVSGRDRDLKKGLIRMTAPQANNLRDPCRRVP